MICIPTPNHRKLVQDCYPPSKKLAGSENPNSNELGKLVYYAQTKPAKLTKVGKLLQDRATSDSRAIANAPSQEKARCGLLITLAILKSLIQECPQDIAYISKSAQTALLQALGAARKGGPNGTRDLQLDSRVSSTFFAFTAALDPSRTSIEDDLGRTYLSLLDGFAQMSLDASKPDQEDKNRHRLIGLGALSGAVSSEVMYTASFSQQVAIIVPALLGNIGPDSQPLEHLKVEAQKTVSGSPSFAEFTNAAKKRPTHRKAPSLSAHVAGEKGPSTTQVVSAAMGVLQGHFRHADASQVQELMKHVFAALDGRGGTSLWPQEDWACLIAKTITRWSALHYRFVVLNSLVEHLVEGCEGQSTAKDATLLAMIAEILQSKDLTLVGLSTSDTLNNLAGLAVRRVHYDIKDPLLPQIVECIESIAVHTYYADQVNDVADELVARIVALTQPDADVAGATATVTKTTSRQASSTTSLEQRAEAIRILLFALTRVILVANAPNGGGGSGEHVQNAADGNPNEVKGKSVGPAVAHRQRIQPEVLQPTTSLLASPNASIRLGEAQLLLAYLQYEGSADAIPAASSEAASLLHGISAATHVAAISKSLRIAAASSTEKATPLQTLVAVQTANDDAAAAAAIVEAGTGTAVPIDYAALSEVLIAAVDSLGASTILAIVPALFAIDRSAAQKLVPDSHSPNIVAQKRRATRLLLAKVWEAIGRRWAVASVEKEAQGILAALADGFPPVPPVPTGLTLAADTDLFPETALRGEGSVAASEVFNSASIVKGLAGSKEVQEASGLGQEELARWLQRDWSVSIAVDDSSVGASPYQDGGFSAGGDGMDVAGNHAPPHRMSFASGAGVGAAGVNGRGGVNATAGGASGANASGVDSLRQALGTRSYGAGGSLNKQSSVGVDDHHGSASLANSTTSSSLSAAERRASRRASRGGLRNGGGAGGAGEGVNGDGPSTNGLLPTTEDAEAESRGSIGGLLDSLGVAKRGGSAAVNDKASSTASAAPVNASNGTSSSAAAAGLSSPHAIVPPHAV